MFAMTISQLFNDDVLKRASIVSICQFASLSLVSLKETPLHINTKICVLFRINIVGTCAQWVSRYINSIPNLA